MLDAEVREKFKEFQEKTGKYDDLDIDEVQFEKKTIDDIVLKFIKGSTPKYSPDTTDYVVIKSGQARGNYNEFNFKKMAYLDFSKVKTIKTLQKGDILINTTGVGTAGRVTLFDLDGNYVSDSHITALRYDLSLYNKFYLLYFFVNFGFKRLESMAEGTGGQIELSMELVKRIDIPIPKNLDKTYTCIKIQEAIVAFLEFWKDGYTDVFRERVSKKKPIYEAIKRVLVHRTFKNDKFITEKFNEFTKINDYNIMFKNIEFAKTDLFNDTENIQMIGSKKIGTHDELDKINDKDGIPVYDASANILTYVSKNKYPNEVFTVKNNDNPNISFASEGNSSAGTNFIIHKGSYYVNNHRIVIKFSDKYYSKYIYYNIYKMKEKYGFKRGYIPSQQELRRLKIMVDIPIDLSKEYTSLELEKIFVDFWEELMGQIDKQLEVYQRMSDVTDIIDRAFLYRTFGKIDWSQE